MNINKKVQQYPIMYHKNEKYQIMGPKLSGQPIKESKKPIISPEDIKYIQKLVGKFLYYARALDLTMLEVLETLPAAQ